MPTITGELIAGHAYVLTETKAPDGYALITESLHFTVGRKGRAASVTAGSVEFLTAGVLQQSVGYSFFSALNPFLVHY